jgi:NAD(P)-dependent dehydrogenase (short-subunit alcohol dehydrogenase family)
MATQGKSVLVTGASGGIGSAVVRELDDRGWHVFAGVRSVRAGEALARGRKSVVPVQLDICDEASVAAAAQELARRLGGAGLFGLVNNAGLSVDGPLELIPIRALREQFEVNVVGQIAVTQALLPLLRLARGRVVNVGGAAGRMTLPMFGALSASKAALDSLSNALRMELKHLGVDVSYVEPGGLQTRFFEKSAEAAVRNGFAGTPETQQIYAKAIEASKKALAASKAEPVDAAVRAVVTALTARRPAARYVVGHQAKMGLLVLPKMPARVRDRVLMAGLGLGPEVFGGPPQLNAGTQNGAE